MKHKIALAISTLSLSVTGVLGLGPVSPATAGAVAAEICDNNVCLYEDDNYSVLGGGSVWLSLRPAICYTLTPQYNNWASSMRNGYDRSVWFYDRANCVGAVGYIAAPNSSDKDLTNNGFDNKTSSLLM
ncbi:peptidase inhibitor family I36 protein [Sinosporangium siamense]|uniref:Peptidase inhibitor family I36 n=1 Tax=Sinosporangium siamense TaxID=1367973 RepID=A0A919RN12_9ACTN|nr:peptidase inhibitor family I36 protein [Sinosporangium siamense]GII96787.1 hypothetical protein Ssi02_70180 [Sinosporangium siamense]